MLPTALRPLTLSTLLLMAPAAAMATPVLRVGLADGSQPCSYRQQGSWGGMAVELWQRIADQEQLPYVLVPQQNTAQLLSATRQGVVDVAIGCITVSPERLHNNRFTLPVQETGLGVMTRRSRLDLAGDRVAVRRGSVSDERLQALNSAGLRPQIQLQELESIPHAESLLWDKRVDAVVADELQLDFLLHQLNSKRYGLALRDLQPQSQAFALAPGLSEAIAGRINGALGRLKRDGVVSQLRREAIQGSRRQEEQL